jgi:hypothetical protein
MRHSYAGQVNCRLTIRNNRVNAMKVDDSLVGRELARSANAPRLPGIVRGAAPLGPAARVTTPSPFRAVLISRLTRVTANLPASANYYRRLLGAVRARGAVLPSVGPSDFVLAHAPGTECIRVAVSSFEVRTAVRALSSLGAVSDAARDGHSVSVHDPDQILPRASRQGELNDGSVKPMVNCSLSFAALRLPPIFTL